MQSVLRCVDVHQVSVTRPATESSYQGVRETGCPGGRGCANMEAVAGIVAMDTSDGEDVAQPVGNL